MEKFLIPFAGLFALAPAHALPIVSLHGAGSCPVVHASTMVDAVLLILSVAALATAVAFRVHRRKVVQQRSSISQR